MNELSGYSNKPSNIDRYEAFKKNTQIGKLEFDLFIEYLATNMLEYDKANPYKKNSLENLTSKANSFLQKHSTLNYQEFLEQTPNSSIVGVDYDILPEGRNLRRRLFKHRSLLYLSTLEEYESEGHELKKLIEQIKNNNIPFMKNEKHEAAFDEIIKTITSYERT